MRDLLVKEGRATKIRLRDLLNRKTKITINWKHQVITKKFAFLLSAADLDLVLDLDLDLDLGENFPDPKSRSRARSWKIQNVEKDPKPKLEFLGRKIIPISSETPRNVIEPIPNDKMLQNCIFVQIFTIFLIAAGLDFEVIFSQIQIQIQVQLDLVLDLDLALDLDLVLDLDLDLDLDLNENGLKNQIRSTKKYNGPK